MKKYFITGLVILLPVALTIGIVIFFFNLLTTPFLGAVKVVFEKYGLFEEGFLFLSPRQLQNLIAQFMILLSLFAVTVTLGFVARWFFFHSLLGFAEYIVKKIPLVSSIYKTCKEVINTLFTSTTNSFKQVVLVPFPSASSYAIGFITKDEVEGLENTEISKPVAIFIPTTPNPTSGFLVFYEKKEIIPLDMKVEEAFKCVISCGVIAPRFSPATLDSNP